MNVVAGFTFPLRLTKDQEEKCARFSGSCRWIWNHSLTIKRSSWEERKENISWIELSNKLPSIKTEHPWLKESPSQSLQQVCRDLDQAFKHFFRRVKLGEKPGYPRYHKKGVKDSFRLSQGIKILPDFSKRFGKIQLPKLGVIKYRKHMEIKGVIQNATISKLAGKWYISFCCKDVPIESNNLGDGAIGIDRGIAAFAAMSDGRLIKSPEPGKKLKNKVAKLQRRMAKKKKFSNNWRKQKAKLQKLHSKIGNIRKDFLHKLSTEIVKNHAVVVVENLKTKNMTRSAKGTMEEPGKNVAAKAGLNRSILDQGWHAFETMLTYKLAWRCGELIKVKPHYTSQTCFRCGHVSKDNRVSQVLFQCQQCGFEDNADLNAARNILAAGRVANACGGDSVGNLVKQETCKEKTTNVA